MKPVERIDLAAEFDSAEAAILQERREDVLKKIRCIFGGYYAAEGSVRKLKAELVKAEESLRKQQEKLAAIKAGDWNAVPDKLPDSKDKDEQS